jgi:hypothetical protein
MKHGLNIEDIEKIIDSGLLTKDESKILGILLTAANDWSVNSSTLEEYVNQIEETIGSIATMQSLEKFLADVDFQKYAWQAESITQLLEIYEFIDKKKPLKEIVKSLEKSVVK